MQYHPMAVMEWDINNNAPKSRLMETEGETVCLETSVTQHQRGQICYCELAGCSSLPISSSFYMIHLWTLWGFHTDKPIAPLAASFPSPGWKWRYPKHDKPPSFLHSVQCSAWLHQFVCSGDWLAGNASNCRQVVAIICGIWWLAIT